MSPQAFGWKKNLFFSNTRLHLKKQLGQNFLIDDNISKKIINACQLSPEDIILEIGPGLGALTENIAPHVRKVIAVETDKRFYKELLERFSYSNVSIIHQDFLKFNTDSLPSKAKVIGNLPYHISSAIIGKLLKDKRHFTSAFVTVQKEFAQRLIGKIHTKDYSALSCFVQYHSKPSMLFKIKKSSFYPKPKVDSCFVHLEILSKPLYSAENEDFLFQMIRQAFEQRRKMLPNSLSSFINKNNLLSAFKKLHLNPRLRAENFSIKNYVELSNLLNSHKQLL